MFAPQERAIWWVSGLEHGRIAVGSDPLDAIGHAVFGICLIGSGEREAAIMETTRAVALTPNNATVQGGHGGLLAFSGRAGEGLPYLAQAIRLVR